MKLYIVRHGKAEKESPSGSDADRRLRPRGIAQAKFLGQQFAAMSPRPGLILTSGLTRALSTAKVISEVLKCPLQEEPVLQLGHAAEAVLEAIPRAAPQGDIMVVGHNPQLEELLDLLVGPDSDVDRSLRTGEAVLLEITRREDPAGSARVLKRWRMDE